MKKIIATILSCVCLVSYVACADEAKNDNSSVSSSSSSTSSSTVVVTEDEAIFYKGKTEYKIVVSDEMTANDGLAVSEFPENHF